MVEHVHINTWYINYISGPKIQESYSHLHRYRKGFQQNPHTFTIESLKNHGTEETYLNIIKAKYANLTANIILHGEKVQSISTKIRNKTK